MIELKPCPFCGKTVDYWHDAGMDIVGVRCGNCKIAVRMLSLKQGKTFGDTMACISERWNRRSYDGT